MDRSGSSVGKQHINIDHPLNILRNSPHYTSDPHFRRRADMRIAREQKFAGGRLFNLDIEITTICNLACRTCYNVSTKPQIMTVEQFSRILADARQLVECLEMDGL